MHNTQVQDLFSTTSWIEAIFSNPRKKDASIASKLTIRPVHMKQKLYYQLSEQKQQKVFHRNLSQDECLRYILDECLPLYKQIIVFSPQGDYQLLTNKKGHTTVLERPPSKKALSLSHNVSKNYLLNEETPLPFLVQLGVMNSEGRVLPKKYDKFRQINRFLEMVKDVLPAFEKKKKLHIIDLGCGKGYLTFALYHYLHEIYGYTLTLEGIDLKADVMADCQALATRIGFTGLRFSAGDMIHFTPTEPVDMVVALHACDTATDVALAHAIRWDAQVILSAPCCQHELYSQIKSPMLEPILRHGILKERFAALATDAARALLLETKGYKSQVLEFVDPEHTPKNLLIRAVKGLPDDKQQEARKQYAAFKKQLSITPKLELLVDMC